MLPAYSWLAWVYIIPHMNQRLLLFNVVLLRVGKKQPRAENFPLAAAFCYELYFYRRDLKSSISC